MILIIKENANSMKFIKEDEIMLDLSGHGYGAHNMESLVSHLKHNTDIENLKLYCNNIDGEAL